jgi:hypothetical protein
MIAVQTCLLVVLAVLWEWANDGLWGLGLHLATFFVCAMVCHGELARNRPETEYLTEFYLWISVGGLLGSIFTVLVAPAVFNSVLEYPLMLIAACFLRPPKSIQPLRLRWEIVVSVVFLEVFGLMTFSESVRTNFSLILYAALGTTLYLLAGRRVSLAAGLALLLMARPGEPTEGKLLAQERTFYGVYRVRELDNGRFNVLSHGSTVHGIQEMRERDRHRPFLYFHQDGPLGQLFAALDREGRTIQHIGVAGLGIGSIASYKKPDQHLTFFEIDPVMEKLARDPRFFTFLSQFGKKIDVVTGDARLSIAKQPDDRFDLLILDAFSSDAVPIHLMTREAVAVYLQKLRANGLLVFNISNRYVRLAPILGALADDAGLIALNQTFSPTKAQSGAGASASNWIVIGRTAADLEVISTDPRWQRVHGERGRKSILWTDDYADLIRVVVPPDWLRR